MRIVVLDGHTLNPGDNPWDEVASLGELQVFERTPPELLLERSRDARIVLTNKTPIPAEALGQLPDLRFIAVLATGYNIVDVDAARERSVPVSNVPVYGTDSVAQFVFALLLGQCHHVGRHDAAIRAGRWQASANFSFWETPLIELAGLTMGIIGFGRIGRRVGELAHAFGMRVLVHDPVPTAPPPYEPFGQADLEEVCASADVISLHCPQTADNVGFINGELLARMKQSAILINTARGALVVEADLSEALKAGIIGAAALDVVSAEPLSSSSPLLDAPNLLLTPHIAWATLAARRRLMKETAANVRAFQAGNPTNVVN
jgi:glycerate dehydrogenase